MLSGIDLKSLVRRQGNAESKATGERVEGERVTGADGQEGDS
jgi:hypothetical protein